MVEGGIKNGQKNSDVFYGPLKLLTLFQSKDWINNSFIDITTTGFRAMFCTNNQILCLLWSWKKIRFFIYFLSIKKLFVAAFTLVTFTFWQLPLVRKLLILKRGLVPTEGQQIIEKNWHQDKEWGSTWYYSNLRKKLGGGKRNKTIFQ